MLAPRPQPNDLQLSEMAAGCVRASSELGFMVSLGYQTPLSCWPEDLKKRDAMDTEANSGLAEQSCFHLCKG